MKRILVLAFFLLAAGSLFANPPSFGAVSYDAATKLLTVQVKHDITVTQVTDPAKHFVKVATISVNGVIAVTQSYTSQEGNKGLTIVSRLILNSGDKVDLTAQCNLRGDSSTSYIVP
jgi:hypothetical protein